MLVFLSLLGLIILFQGYLVPQPDFLVSEVTHLTPTEYPDQLVVDQPDKIEYNQTYSPEPPAEAEEDPEQKPLVFESNLLGSKSFTSQLPRIQHTFTRETEEQAAILEIRRASVKDGFRHAWKGYSKLILLNVLTR